MSKPAGRVGDLSTGHGPYPPRPIEESNVKTVFINRRNPAHIGAKVSKHCYKDVCHGGTVSTGSSSVSAEGKSLSTITDSVSCGDDIMTGSSNVSIGGT